MSDATLPPPRPSSAAPASEGGNQSDSSTVEDDSNTSLIQSVSTETKEEGQAENEGKTDNKQKRKRTSPEDQKILEAEYKKNPKPNKQARTEIVEKVTLNEKEVQIWFQNRRQITRRKSRPLLPHEIVAFGLGGMAALSSDPAPMICLSSPPSALEPVTSSLQDEMDNQDNLGSSQDLEPSVPQHPEACVEAVKNEAPEAVESNPRSLPPSLTPTLKPRSSSQIPITEASLFSSTDSVTKSFSSTPGYLANRWNAVDSSFSTPSSSHVATFETPSISNPIQPSSCPERISQSNSEAPSSRVRLSMSLDGKAELISSDPSPPRAHPLRPSSSGSAIPQKRMRGLQRSQSALPFGPLPRKSPTTAPFVPRLASGRSRDARTWEFCCDTEARDELTTQAENESSGSAVAAINLIRSTSSSALKPNTNKRNAPAVKHDQSKHGKKPKLGRAMSSLARLQSTEKQSNSPQIRPTKDKDGLMRSPSGDSDKENWIPTEAGGNARRRPLPSSRSDKQASSKAVLGDNFNVPTHAVNFGGNRNKKRKPAYEGPNVFEDRENSEVPADVEKFMQGDISPSKKGDLDCVQGLLSLSQGNWR